MGEKYDLKFICVFDFYEDLIIRIYYKMVKKLMDKIYVVIFKRKCKFIN